MMHDDWGGKGPTDERYVSYTVTVTFQGKLCRPYQAMFAVQPKRAIIGPMNDPGAPHSAISQGLGLRNLRRQSSREFEDSSWPVDP